MMEYTDKPGLLLAVDYDYRSPKGWLMSEKYDGVRALWTGRQLIGRGGRILSAPEWWTRSLPGVAIDGELWLGRGTFAACNGITQRCAGSPRWDGEAWRGMRFMAFDLPSHAGPVEERIEALPGILDGCTVADAVTFTVCKSRRHLESTYETIIMAGGEGLMLRAPGSVYVQRRSDTLLRLKEHAETTSKGKNRYREAS